MNELATILPLTDTTCKVIFIGNDSIKTDDLTELYYGGSIFQVTQNGLDGNRWCIVQASFADFGNNRRVIVGYTKNSSGGGPQLP